MNIQDPFKRDIKLSEFISTLQPITAEEFSNLKPGTKIFHIDALNVEYADMFTKLIPLIDTNYDVTYLVEYINIEGTTCEGWSDGWYYYRKPLPIIESFTGKNVWLSNFYVHSTIWINDWAANTVEHLYQAHKASGSLEAHHILKCVTAADAKRIGNKIELPPDWDAKKTSIMETILRKKFEIPELREKLISTDGQILIEGNWWKDTYWGVCNGVGLNKLGELLMKLRQEITGNSVTFNRGIVYGSVYSRKSA